MVKYFLKGTDQEVKVGNKIVIKVPTKTPYGEGTCEVETLVTQMSLEQLCKDGIVESKEIPEPSIEKLHSAMPDFVEYKPFIRRLARKIHTNFETALAFLDLLHDTSLYAHNCLLLELMAEVMNKDKMRNYTVYMINLGDKEHQAVIKELHSYDAPVFFSMEDARKALELISPFTEYHAGK